MARQGITDEVTEKINELLFSGRFPRGDKLPGENSLAVDFGVSRSTVR